MIIDNPHIYREIIEKTKPYFTPLESSSIPACRQTGMLGIMEIPAKAGASAPYSCLPAGRAGGVKALAFLTGFTHKGADKVVTRMKEDLDTYAAQFEVFADKVWREEYLKPPSITTSCASSSIGSSMAMKSDS